LDFLGTVVYANLSWGGRNDLSYDHTVKVQEFKDSDFGISSFNKECEWKIGYRADLSN